MTLSLLDHLNPQQHAAVTLPATCALVLAGAGSGKTRVLTTRIAWLIQTNQVSPSGIMAVTFTNKAAQEMRLRLGSLVPVNLHTMWIGTFHGLCHRLLRLHHQAAGLPATFQVMDSQDQLSAVKRVIKAMNLDEERFVPKQMQWFISACKEEGKRPHHLQAPDAMTQQKIEIYTQYQTQCEKEGAVDFGELMLRSYELLQKEESLAQHYQARFRHILIDEFQDTNTLQYSWIARLAGYDRPLDGATPAHQTPRAAVIAVGDDDQSIYAFRGAQVGNMQRFVTEFGVAPDHTIRLERNYRSLGNILEAANGLIAHNTGRLGKTLYTEEGVGELIRVRECPSDFDEARFVVEEVRQLHREGQARTQMAVLYRSNAQSRALENALFNSGIPYRVYGGQRFFERAEIKHALAYLRLLENPQDDTSFLRVVNFPTRGIGARSVEQLQDAALGSGLSLIQTANQATQMGQGSSSVRAFVQLIEGLRQDIATLSLQDTMALVLERSGLLAHYRKEKDGQDRVDNLQELLAAAQSFVHQEGFGKEAQAAQTALTEEGETLSPLAAFLTHAALESGDNQAAEGQDAVQLMTIHAAKGLEFNCVFMTGLEETLFPHENALSDIKGLEEERRLMYVALTRARQRLYLTHAQTRMLHGQTRYHLRSRFVDEIPPSTLKFLSGMSGMSGGGGSSRITGGQGWQSYRETGRSSSESQVFPQSPVHRPSPIEQASSSSEAIRVGMQVFHTKFGQGKVVSMEGQGPDARAQVAFIRHGVKWLALSIAKLTPV